MKMTIFKYASIFIILMFCLAPLSAVDLAQDNDTKYINEENDSGIEIKDANITADNDGNEIDDVKLDKKTEIDNDKALNETLDEKENSPIVIHAKDIYEDHTALIEFISEEPINTNLIVTVGNKQKRVFMKDGYGSLHLEGLAPGRYTVKILNYEPHSQMTFTVKANVDPKLQVGVNGILPGEVPVVTVHTKGDYKGEVTIKLGNETKTVKGGTYAEVAFDQDLLPGEYKVEVVSSADGHYTEIKKTEKLVVDQRRIAIDVHVDDVEVGQPVLVTANTTKHYDGYVLCYIDDITDNIRAYEIAEDGQISHLFEDADLSPGVHKMHVFYLGTKQIEGSSKDVEFTVKSKF